MKRLILLLFAFIAINVHASTFATIVNASFNAVDSIQPGSQQFVDVRLDYWDHFITDSISIAIKHGLVNSADPLFGIKTISVSSDYFLLPLNPDGNSRRIYFWMPPTFAAGVFHAFSNYQTNNTGVAGVFYTAHDTAVATSVKLNIQKLDIKETNYFSLSGQKLVIPSGLFIKQVIYMDGSMDVKQVYQCPF